jgi:hypothetical protein
MKKILLACLCALAIPIVLEVRARAAAPAIAFDAATSDAQGALATSRSTVFTVGAGTNRFLLVVIGQATGTAAPTTVTWNTSESLTKVLDHFIFNSAADVICNYRFGTYGQSRASVWRLVAPTATTANVTITYAANTVWTHGILSLQNVDQTTPLGTISESCPMPNYSDDAINFGSPSASLGSTFQDFPGAGWMLFASYLNTTNQNGKFVLSPYDTLRWNRFNAGSQGELTGVTRAEYPFRGGITPPFAVIDLTGPDDVYTMRIPIRQAGVTYGS